jgi:hypothetical protein
MYLSLITIPNVLLSSLLGLAVWVLYSASRSTRFDPVDMLLDERGKASSSRLAVFVALAVSTFMLVFFTTNKGVDDETLLYMFGVYIMTWAGSKTLEKGVEAWSNRRPSSSSRRYDRYDEDDSYGGYTDAPRMRYSRPSQHFDPPQVTHDDEFGSLQTRLDPIPQFTPTALPAKEDLSENRD